MITGQKREIKLFASYAVSFTIGPKDPAEDLAGFKTYATKMGDLDPAKVEATIGGVIHGEVQKS